MYDMHSSVVDDWFMFRPLTPALPLPIGSSARCSKVSHATVPFFSKCPSTTCGTCARVPSTRSPTKGTESGTASHQRTTGGGPGQETQKTVFNHVSNIDCEILSIP